MEDPARTTATATTTEPDDTQGGGGGGAVLRPMPSNETADTNYEDANEFPQVAVAAHLTSHTTNNGAAATVVEHDPQVVVRQGTIASARFNILSTMVGGGSLSLPLAFQKSGNALLGPVFLVVTAAITEFCFRVLLDATRTVTPVTVSNNRLPSHDSFESIAAAAFGKGALKFCTVLVTLMCFFGIVGYAVLLRDMLEPVADAIFSHIHRDSVTPTWQDNATMLAVVLGVTPLCTLQTLTALKKFGAASMCSILILGACILFRSLECTMGLSPNDEEEYYDSNDNEKDHHWTDGFQFFPDNWKDVLDVLPLYISCYVCHYNLMPVHNELQRPSGARVRWWLRSTVWGSTLFYLTLGIAGSAYGACSEGEFVQGNILLDFPEDDPLLLIGRMCLAVTITLAFPMLTIPARDILIRTLSVWKTSRRQVATSATAVGGEETTAADSLREPLLENGHTNEQSQFTDEEEAGQTTDEQDEAAADTLEETSPSASNGIGPLTSAEQAASPDDASNEACPPPSLVLRLLASIVVFWTGAAVASCVSSIDIVWDLLGSSLSILLSHLIPCGSFLVISKRKPRNDDGSRSVKDTMAVAVAWLLVLFFTPLMFVSTANAVYNTFFRK